MTDKEIIIDEVNVTGCNFHSSTPSSELCYMNGNKCNDNPHCHYKQLQRSIDRIKDLEERIINHADTIEEYCDRLARKEQECEELKAYIKSKEGLGDDCDFCKHNNKSECYANANIEFAKENTRYKQALEKIKDIVTQINFTVAGGEESPKWEWIRLYRSIVYEVSRIINEVKE